MTPTVIRLGLGLEFLGREKSQDSFDFYFVVTKVHSIVTVRDAKHTNFVEFRNFKIIYRR